jgi:hypothetical protein
MKITTKIPWHMYRVCYPPIRINGIEEIRIYGTITRCKHKKKFLGHDGLHRAAREQLVGIATPQLRTLTRR